MDHFPPKWHPGFFLPLLTESWMTSSSEETSWKVQNKEGDKSPFVIRRWKDVHSVWAPSWAEALDRRNDSPWKDNRTFTTFLYSHSLAPDFTRQICRWLFRCQLRMLGLETTCLSRSRTGGILDHGLQLCASPKPEIKALTVHIIFHRFAANLLVFEFNYCLRGRRGNVGLNISRVVMLLLAWWVCGIENKFTCAQLGLSWVPNYTEDIQKDRIVSKFGGRRITDD